MNQNYNSIPPWKLNLNRDDKFPPANEAGGLNWNDASRSLPPHLQEPVNQEPEPRKSSTFERSRDWGPGTSRDTGSRISEPNFEQKLHSAYGRGERDIREEGGGVRISGKSFQSDMKYRDRSPPGRKESPERAVERDLKDRYAQNNRIPYYNKYDKERPGYDRYYEGTYKTDNYFSGDPSNCETGVRNENPNYDTNVRNKSPNYDTNVRNKSPNYERKFRGSFNENPGYERNYNEKHTDIGHFEESPSYKKCFKESPNYEMNLKESPYERSFKQSSSYERSFKHSPNYEKTFKERPSFERNFKESSSYERSVKENPGYERSLKESSSYERSLKESTSYERSLKESYSYERSLKESPSYEKRFKESSNYERSLKESPRYERNVKDSLTYKEHEEGPVFHKNNESNINFNRGLKSVRDLAKKESHERSSSPNHSRHSESHKDPRGSYDIVNYSQNERSRWENISQTSNARHQQINCDVNEVFKNAPWRKQESFKKQYDPVRSFKGTSDHQKDSASDFNSGLRSDLKTEIKNENPFKKVKSDLKIKQESQDVMLLSTQHQPEMSISCNQNELYTDSELFKNNFSVEIHPVKIDGLMEHNDTTLIHKALINNIEDMAHKFSNGEEQPQLCFRSPGSVIHGVYRLICNDEFTYNWMLSWKPPTCRQMELQVHKNLIITYRFGVKFFEIGAWDLETALHHLRADNKKLETKYWKCLANPFNIKKGIVTVTFDVDGVSEKIIREANYMLSYKNAVARFMKLKKRPLPGKRKKPRK